VSCFSVSPGMACSCRLSADPPLCDQCGGEGHWSSNCPNKNNSGAGPSRAGNANQGYGGQGGGGGGASGACYKVRVRLEAVHAIAESSSISSSAAMKDIGARIAQMRAVTARQLPTAIRATTASKVAEVPVADVTRWAPPQSLPQYMLILLPLLVVRRGGALEQRLSESRRQRLQWRPRGRLRLRCRRRREWQGRVLHLRIIGPLEQCVSTEGSEWRRRSKWCLLQVWRGRWVYEQSCQVRQRLTA
jgi:hypothetical protein